MGVAVAAESEKRAAPRLRYNSPLVQVILIGFVCFCCPGMFNALNSMGGGGQVSKTASNNANTALYATFAVFGVLGGGIYNLLGPRFTLLFGSSFYVLFAGSYLFYNHHQDAKGDAFNITAGALLGMGAGLLWAGQGAIMMSYPPERLKGRYISIFWSIFNLGAMIGGFLPFGLNYNRPNAQSVNDATYIGFMVIMSFGSLLTLALLTPDRVVRDDGSRVTAIRYSNPFTEGWEILKLFLTPKLLLLAPACVASNFFYTYQFNGFNASLFNVRTRGFNGVFYWGAQMLGATVLGFLLDACHPRRKVRGFVGIAVVAVFGMVTWGGGLAKQLEYSRYDLPPELDFKSGPEYAGPFILFVCYGLLDAMYQTLCYWTMGALTDDALALSRYAGFYKGVQSAGAAVAWQLDAHKVRFLVQLLVNWGLLVLSIPLLMLIMKDVKDSCAGDAPLTAESSAKDGETAKETV
ncbi:hypothetical protein SELMODRAFT_448749 [Selaginella moellendorffii]|uniref:Major facilitator superfamily (MFS) profile domain-containing protein n=1 Tax=Selaginella moellendorffii TaxID=88036 RepID=D8T9W8_SELML|nr:UNC93-like protein 1 [Selaginella moellendorffii]EFJ06520.1 hypothetical protein SELMODRAFT_448749 [Selaginella moellendorffii]|eukprot:XP_002992370.1 UNC93-like protein 1 [Selaginella moellendorffii]